MVTKHENRWFPNPKRAVSERENRWSHRARIRRCDRRHDGPVHPLVALQVVQVFPSTASLERLAGAVMCDMDEAWNYPGAVAELGSEGCQ